MKTATSVVLAFALALSVVPAIANDTFHAFSSLPAVEQTGLTPLSDDQLAAVEGAAVPRPLILIINTSVNVAVLPQINVCVVCEDVVQTNIGVIAQVVSRRR
jgi:hypothetical protein